MDCPETPIRLHGCYWNPLGLVEILHKSKIFSPEVLADCIDGVSCNSHAYFWVLNQINSQGKNWNCRQICGSLHRVSKQECLSFSTIFNCDDDARKCPQLFQAASFLHSDVDFVDAHQASHWIVQQLQAVPIIPNSASKPRHSTTVKQLIPMSALLFLLLNC